MVIARTRRFDDEARRYALRFCCEDCGYFDAATEHCRHDWPTASHRRARYAPAPGGSIADPEASAVDVVFCKEFELA